MSKLVMLMVALLGVGPSIRPCPGGAVRDERLSELPLSQQSAAQGVRVVGVVTGPQGKPIPEVSVTLLVISGTTQPCFRAVASCYAVTDEDGKFEFGISKGILKFTGVLEVWSKRHGGAFREVSLGESNNGEIDLGTITVNPSSKIAVNVDFGELSAPTEIVLRQLRHPSLQDFCSGVHREFVLDHGSAVVDMVHEWGFLGGLVLETIRGTMLTVPVQPASNQSERGMLRSNTNLAGRIRTARLDLAFPAPGVDTAWIEVLRGGQVHSRVRGGSGAFSERVKDHYTEDLLIPAEESGPFLVAVEGLRDAYVEFESDQSGGTPALMLQPGIKTKISIATGALPDRPGWWELHIVGNRGGGYPPVNYCVLIAESVEWTGMLPFPGTYKVGLRMYLQDQRVVVPLLSNGGVSCDSVEVEVAEPDSYDQEQAIELIADMDVGLKRCSIVDSP